MLKSGCMKIQISGKEPEVLSFIDFDFTAALENNPNASVEYLMVLSFLYKFFPSRINYDSPLPSFGISSFYSEFSIGTSYSKDNLEGYSDLNPTLACFSESSLKESLVLQLGLGKEALSLTIPQLEVLLKQNLGSSATIYSSPVNLKVLRCSSSDLAAADADGVSVSPMEDVFDYLTPRLRNTTPRLGKEYTVAEYTTGSSEITFNSEYAVGLDEFPLLPTVLIINKEGFFNNTHMYFSVEVNGVLYNAEKLDLSNHINVPEELSNLISFYLDSGGVMYISPNVFNTELKVRLSPSEAQKVYSKDFHTGGDDDSPTQGGVLPNGDFIFRLYREETDW